jgi:NitT/TauT family transport system permease protein
VTELNLATGTLDDASASVSLPVRRPVRLMAGSRDDSPRLRRLMALVVVVVLVGIWEAAVRLGYQDEFWISRPTLIAGRIGDWLTDGTLQHNLLPTLKVAFISFLIAGLGAFVVAALLHWSRWLDDVLGWYLAFIYAVPKPALIPLFIFAFGLGPTADYVVVVSFVFFIFYFNIRAGLATPRQHYQNALGILGAKRRHVLWELTLPSLVPFLVASARFGLPLAILGTVFAEFFTTSPGMGRLIVQAQFLLDSTTMMTAIVVLIIVGAVLDSLLRGLDRRVSRWRI